MQAPAFCPAPSRRPVGARLGGAFFPVGLGEMNMPPDNEPTIEPFMMYKPGKKVNWAHPTDVIDRAIGVPDELRSADGRVFHLRRWDASVSEHGVEVTGTFLVSLTKEACDEQIH